MAWVATAVFAAAAIYGAYDSNQKLKKSANVANKNAKIESGINAQNAELEREQKMLDAEQVRGRLAVLGADSGGGSLIGAETNVTSDLFRNNDIIQINSRNRDLVINSQLEATIASIGQRIQSPFLAGLQGGAQGYTLGKSMGSGGGGGGGGDGGQGVAPSGGNDYYSQGYR